MCILITILSLYLSVFMRLRLRVYIYIRKTWIYLHNNEGKINAKKKRPSRRL